MPKFKHYPRALVRKTGPGEWSIAILHRPTQDPTDQVYTSVPTAEMAWNYVIMLTRQRRYLVKTL